MKLFQLLVAAMLLISSAIVLAEKPDPVDNPPLQVREANTVNGWIAVHEQGTAKVDIQNTELNVNVTGGEIEVTGGEIEINNTSSNPVPVNVENLPVEQAVVVNAGQLSPVTRVYYDTWSLAWDGSGQHCFASPINATTISINNFDSELNISFKSPLAPDLWVLNFTDTDAEYALQTYSFTYPIPLSCVAVGCLNESDPCLVEITVFGF